MRKKFNQTLSTFLVIVMIISLLPIQVFARIDGQSVILPIGEEHSTNGISVMRASNENMIYLSRGSISVSLPDIEFLGNDSESIEGARIQAVDGYNTVAAQTGSFDISNHYSTISGKTLFALELIPEGEYPLQIIYGDVQEPVTIPLDYVLIVVDAPVIAYGNVSDLTEGIVPFRISLDIAGFDGDAERFSFALVDEVGAEISCEAEHIRTESLGSYGISQITYSLIPESDIVLDTMYSLEIIVRNGELYSNAKCISTEAKTYSNEIAILEVTPNDTVIGGLDIKVGGIVEVTDYTISVTQGSSNSSTNYVYNNTVQPVMDDGNGIFSIVLSKNGLTLPLSAYGRTSFYIEVMDNEGNQDSIYYYNETSYESQSVDLSLKKAGNNIYEFTLTGRNMLLDLFEDNNLSFSLKKHDNGVDIAVGNISELIEKSSYFSDNSAYFVFSGRIDTNEILKNGNTYVLYQMNERLASTSTVNGGEIGTLDIYRLNIANYEYSSNSFYFNFGQLPIEATLISSNNTAIAQLYDITDNEIVSQTENVTGTLDDDGNYEFLFVINKPEVPLDTNHKYTIRIISNGQTAEWNAYSFSYDSEVITPQDFDIVQPIFMGDTTIILGFYYNDLKNVTLDYYMDNKVEIINQANDTSLDYTKVEAIYKDYSWYLTLTLSKPIDFGSYKYGLYSTFDVIASGTPILGNTRIDSKTKTISIIDCYGLTDAAYTAILYDTEENGYGKLSNLTLTRKNESTLQVTSGLPSNLAKGSYTMEVYADNTYIGTVYLYISWDDNLGVCVIKGYNSNYREILYETDSNEIYLYTNNPGYSYVRYSEKNDFSDTSYAPIREYYYQPIMLSKGNGVKTIYVQFKTADGKESPVYTWICEKVEELTSPYIVRAWVSVDELVTTYVPFNTEFAINLISNSRLSDAYAEFTGIDGTTYYKTYPLIYKGEIDESFLFQATLNSRDLPFDNTSYNISTVDCYLTDISRDINYDTMILPISFKPLEDILLTDWNIYGSTVYTNQNSYKITGYATPESTVTVKCNDKEYSTQANAAGVFSVIVTNLIEGKYEITAVDNKGLSTNSFNKFYLAVDTTAPVLDTLKATMVDNNVIISWTTSSEDVEYYFIWRDGGVVKGAYDKYTATSYIVAGAAGSTFKVVAVDHAGNQSEEKTVSVGDSEPPTTPGTPTMTANGTKSISFSWAASTDNVAVYQYAIYRDDELLETVDYSTTSYRDTGLSEGTEYKYQVYAIDRASNASEAAEASLSTAVLKISSSTDFLSEYIKEEVPDGVRVSLALDNSDSYYDISQCIAKFQYKLTTDAEWPELLLTDIGSTRSGTWSIEDLAVGTYMVRFHVIDIEGTEKTTTESTVQISQDMIPPTVTITSPYSDSILSGKNLTIIGDSNDNVEVSRVELSYSLDDGESFTEIAVLNNEKTLGRSYFSWNHIFDATALPSGNIVIKATAYDGRDNVSDDTVTFIIDNTPPDTPYGFHISSTSEYIGILWSYPDQEDTSDFSKFKVYRSTLADGPFEYIGGDSGVNFYDTAGKGIEADTLYYYYVTAVDIRENESAPTAVLSGIMSIDNTPPTIASYLPHDNAELCKKTTISVSLYDNSLLKGLDISYRKKGEEQWIPLTSIETDKGSIMLTYDWNVSTLDSGNYQIKLTATDSSNLQTDRIVEYIVKAYSPPVAPSNATATGIGHRSIKLDWDYTGDSSLLFGFSIMRKDAENNDYVTLKTISDSKARAFIDENLMVGKEYSYKIVAIDRWDELAESIVVSATAPSNDTEPPVAMIAAANLTIAKGRTLTLTSSGSTDNDEIASYAWDFGDGTTESGETVSHAYTTEGSYDITLTVTDLADNKDTDTITVQVIDMSTAEGMREITLEVVDSTTTSPLSAAEIKIVSKSTEADSPADIILVTDNNGKASVVLKDGDYIVQTTYNSYLLRTNSLKVGGDSSTNMTIGMSRSNMLVGSMAATEMTYDEIIEAGIDVNDPENQHVYRFAVVLEFTPVDEHTYKIPINYFINHRGKILGYEGSGDGGFPFYFGEWKGTIYPISQEVYLIIYGEAKWLKEMFHVQLLLNNTSTTDYIEECLAELTLPEGLSLATMLTNSKNKNTAVQTIGTIAEQSNTRVDWYVRGDVEGEYDLTATVKGIYMPNPEEFSITYTTAKPIKVWAGSALHLFIEAERSATAGQDYRVMFRLENVSDKELYNVSLNIFGGKFFDEYDVSDLEYTGDGGDLSGTWNKGDGKVSAKVLAPGESIGGIFKIVFEGDMIEKDVRYMLTDMFVHTMEGSTTEIGTTLSFINHKDTAIVVIPGIMGSELFSEDTKVWLPETIDYAAASYINKDYETLVKELIFDILAVQITADAGELELKGFFQRKLEELAYALDALHAQKGNMGDITVYAPSSIQYGAANTSYQMVESMKTYTENTYLFSYDWRDDNRKAAAKLKEFIDGLEQEKIVIVAHSMGGLVTSAYEKLCNNESPVDKIITMGTPYLGTPEAVSKMLFFEEFDNEMAAGLVTAAATLLDKVDINFSLGAGDILKEIRDILLDEYIAPVKTAERYSEILGLIEEMDINTLHHYYQGLYQLLPSEVYGNGRFMFYEDGTPLEYSEALRVKTTYDPTYYVDHSSELEKAKTFHSELDESSTQVLAASDKTYFVVGYGNNTAGKITVDKETFEITDIGIENGDGTVTLKSATINGSLPKERSFYYEAKHTPLFSNSNAINLVKNILYDEETPKTEHLLKPYKKIKVECPVHVSIKKNGEVLSSRLYAHNDITSFGKMYLLGKGFDRKIFFIDDGNYDVEIMGYDTGKMDFTVEYFDGVNNDEPLASYVFSDIPITEETKIAFADAAYNELNDDNVMKLIIDNDGDGKTDKIVLPDEGSNDPGNDDNDDDDKNDDNDNVDTVETSDSSISSKPTIKSGEGGSATLNPDRTLNIVIDDGYIIDKIIINGIVVDLSNPPKISPTDKVEIIFVKQFIKWVNPYTDVKETDWFYEAVKYVSEKNLMIGVGNNRFAPNVALNRAMLVTVLWNMEGKPEPKGEKPFSDLMQDWYIKAVIWASENGIVAGYGDGRFGPADVLTREQMAVMLYRYSRYKGYDVSAHANLSRHTDSDDISDWANEAMKWANAEELITGRNATSLAPKETATRAEMASVLKRYLNNY